MRPTNKEVTSACVKMGKSKMFALILWIESNEIDVVSYDHIKKKQNNTLAKWGSSWYPARILKTSEEREWLESLEVTTDGEIITPARRSSISNEVLMQKRQNRQRIKIQESCKAGVKIQQNKNVTTLRPIFNDSESESELSKDTPASPSLLDKHRTTLARSKMNEREKSPILSNTYSLRAKKNDRRDNLLQALNDQNEDSIFDKTSQSRSEKSENSSNACEIRKNQYTSDTLNSEFEKRDELPKNDQQSPQKAFEKKGNSLKPRSNKFYLENSDNDDGSSNSEDEKRKSENARNRSTAVTLREKERNCICSEFPSVSQKDLLTLKRILALANSIHEKQSNSTEFDPDINDESEITVKSTMELIKGSGVIVNAWKLNVIKNTYKRNPKEMVRKLLKLILGEDVLKKSSATGKNGWIPIPEIVYETVEQFVNNNVKKKYAISSQVYRQTITAMCATLRNPKSTQSVEVSKSKKNLSTEESDSKEQDENKDSNEVSSGCGSKRSSEFGKSVFASKKSRMY